MYQDKPGVKSDNRNISKTTEQTDLQTDMMTETTMTTSSATPDIGPLVEPRRGVFLGSTRRGNGIFEGNTVKILSSDSIPVSRNFRDYQYLTCSIFLVDHVSILVTWSKLLF